MVNPPVSLRGYLDDQLVYGGILVDVADTVSDCSWPASNETYRQMRRHPQLAAVLASYTLAIRRATWQVDPAGCRPEVAQLVADDLGLPVAGKDEPGAARVRGVSWADHLRLALLTLPYGHSGFEMLAEVRDGQARLVELSERLPTTICEIHTDRVGRFGGVTQSMYTGKAVPQIPANRMVWYAREREGAAWWGQSILRPAFPAWLISREMLRVTATGHRRFAVGVPTGEWDAGVTPTPAQHTALQQAMSAARVGEEAGMALPPGAHMKLVGLTGTVPDSVAFLRYLDQVMARQALAGFLDLGTSDTGSRALASEFIDLFLLAIQAEAESTADTCTRQAAARLVEWNFGLDESVPSVRVADVGAKHDVTAESLNLLLGSGALSADPALESHIRREYGLPEREAMAPPAPSVQGDTVAAANRKRPSRKRQPPAAQLSLPLAMSAADVPDLSTVQAEQDAAVESLRAQWPALSEPIVASLVATVGATVATGMLAGLATLAAEPAAVAALSAALSLALADLAATAALRAADEVTALGIAATAGTIDVFTLAEHAEVTAQLVASGLANSATKTALLNVGPGVSSLTVENAVRVELDAMVDPESNGFVLRTLASSLSSAQAAGRMATFAAFDGQIRLRASESNELNQCAPCADIDGHEFADVEAAANAYPSGRYIACLGRDRCKGQLYPVPA